MFQNYDSLIGTLLFQFEFRFFWEMCSLIIICINYIFSTPWFYISRGKKCRNLILSVPRYTLFRNKRFGLSKNIRKPSSFFRFFVQLSVFLLWMPWSMSTSTRAFIRGKVMLHEMKNEKTTWVFLYIKCSKFLSVSLEHFIGRKPLISEECI